MTTTRTNLIIAAIAITAGLAPIAVFAGELAVTVNGVRSDKGKIMAQLLKSDAGQAKAVEVTATMQAAKPGAVELLFGGLEAGDYSVMLFHDENGNGKMDTNMFGIPTEGYGFSNNAKGRFGPPKFSEMKVAVGKDGRTTTIAPMSY
jgi:uncharacterized protein (DUF2141 family)